MAGLNFRRFYDGIKVIAKTVSTSNAAGEIEVISTNDNKANYHNGTTPSPIVTESHDSVLTNKTIDADLNTITDLKDDSIAEDAEISVSKLETLGVGQIITSIDGVTNVVVDPSFTDGDISPSAAIQINKLENIGANNVIVGNSGTGVPTAAKIVNANVDAAAAIARTKLASGGANKVLVNDGSGVMSESSVTEAELLAATGSSALTQQTLVDNTTGNAFMIATAAANVIHITYSLNRNGSFETGLLTVIHDGTNVGLAQGAAASYGDCGVTFTTAFSGGGSLLLIQATTTSTGFNCTMKSKLDSWLK